MGTAVKITRVEDIRPGDHVTLTCNGTVVSGTVRNVTHGDATHLDIANLPCVLIVGGGYWWTFVGATREVPALPTEPGSVIVNATIRGEAGHAAFLGDFGGWRSLRPAGGLYLHRPKDITAWEPGRVVPEGGAA